MQFPEFRTFVEESYEPSSDRGRSAGDIRGHMGAGQTGK
jgi:hypothetical protein